MCDAEIRTILLSFHTNTYRNTISGEINGLSISYADLTAIDLSKATGLTSLTITDNAIESLDLTGLTALTQLFAKNNNIATIDLSTNTALEWIELDNNKLTTLDVSACKSLETLQACYNLLTSLTVGSELKSLSQLFFYKNDIKGEAMTTLMSTLPKSEAVAESDKPLVIPFSEKAAEWDYRAEGNVCTTIDVKAAKAQGWRVQTISAGGNQFDYEGSEPITSISSATATSTTATEYFTIDGRRIAKPTQKGIYIINGKKTVIK